jgi:hypothetical protein
MKNEKFFDDTHDYFFSLLFVFSYCGHNGGEQYISRKRICELSRRSSIQRLTEKITPRSVENNDYRNEGEITLRQVLTRAWTKKTEHLLTKSKKATTETTIQSNNNDSNEGYVNYIAASMLMGCRSASLSPNGEYDPDGLVLAHLIAGSLAVIGNLWTVTDGDLDELTKSVLMEWLNHRNFSLLDAVTLARNSAKMKLRYLNGAALVYYGFPLYHKCFLSSLSEKQNTK